MAVPADRNNIRRAVRECHFHIFGHHGHNINPIGSSFLLENKCSIHLLVCGSKRSAKTKCLTRIIPNKEILHILDLGQFIHAHPDTGQRKIRNRQQEPAWPPDRNKPQAFLNFLTRIIRKIPRNRGIRYYFEHSSGLRNITTKAGYIHGSAESSGPSYSDLVERVGCGNLYLKGSIIYPILEGGENLICDHT